MRGEGMNDCWVGDGDDTTELSTRDRILTTAMRMMSEGGVDGTSMRDLASACGLNVASIYHYFPSKEALFDAVVGERGELAARARIPTDESSSSVDLTSLMGDMLSSMVEVDEFIRLIMGETIRGGETARAVGIDLVSTFHGALEEWLLAHRSDEAGHALAPESARLLCAVLVGTFFEYVAGVMETGGDDVSLVMRRRAEETLKVLNLGNWR